MGRMNDEEEIFAPPPPPVADEEVVAGAAAEEGPAPRRRGFRDTRGFRWLRRAAVAGAATARP